MANASAFTVAVTGGAGSGKSVVCNRFRELGAAVIDCDALAREAVLPGTAAYLKIVEYFGKSVVCEDGALDRKRIRRKIVADDAARSALNRLVHPEIVRLMQERMAQAEAAGSGLIVVEVPLLFELGLEDRFDAVVVVSVSSEVQMQRLSARDQISLDQAQALAATQMPDAEKRRKARFLIENNGSIEDVIRAVDALHQKFFQKKPKKSESA